MALKRYSRVPILGLNRFYGTSVVSATIRQGVESGIINFRSDFLKDGQRLDTIAGTEYNGRSDLYWVIAAASGIGWGLQVPPNTILKIPDIDDVAKLIG